jgi:hypothetical protein
MNSKVLTEWLLAAALAVICMLTAGTNSYAGLKAAGLPVDPANGLPTYYQDLSGTTLMPCLDANGFCVLPPAFDLASPLRVPISSGPASVLTPQNFPAEVFYFLADVSASLGPTRKTKFALRTALEGAFTPVVADGNQVTFIKITLQPMSGLKPSSTYTVTHPYGSFTFSTYSSGATRPGPGNQLSSARDGCAEAPCAFTELLPAAATKLGPFLHAAPPNPPRVTSSDGNIYLANPANAVTVAGSPTGNNSVIITGPDIGGTGIDKVTLTDFNLSGKLALMTVDKLTVTFPAQRPGFILTPVKVTVSNLDSVNTLTLGTITLGGTNAAEFLFTPGADLCSGKVLAVTSAAGSSCTFSVNMLGAAPDGTKTATVNIPAKTAAGNAVSANVLLSGVIDTSLPTVKFTIPADGVVNAPLNNSIAITFSKPVQGVNETNFVLSTGNVVVPGTVAFDASSNTALFSPSAALLANTGYTATLTTGITDNLANIFVSNFNFSFITAPPDITPPVVVSVTPANNVTKAPKNTFISATFNEPMDPRTVNPTTFTVSGGVTGTVTYDPQTRTATFTPDSPLAFNKAYTVTIKAGVKSLGNLPTATDFTWTFLTNVTPTAPKLFAPTDTQVVDGTTTVDLQWIKSIDTDTEAVTYHVYYSTDPSMVGSSQVDVVSAGTASSKSSGKSLPLAGLGGYGAGILLAGLTAAGGVRSRRKLFHLITLLLITGMAATACGKKSNAPAALTTTPAAPPLGLVTKSLSGLQPGTTYWWKVVADDGNGGKAESATWSFTTQTPPPTPATTSAK